MMNIVKVQHPKQEVTNFFIQYNQILILGRVIDHYIGIVISTIYSTIFEMTVSKIKWLFRVGEIAACRVITIGGVRDGNIDSNIFENGANANGLPLN